MSSKPISRVAEKNPWRVILNVLLVCAAVLIVGVLVWQGITSGGNPDPTVAHLDHNAVILNTAILVFREGLEAILVLSAITASLVKAKQSYRKPIALGSGLGLLATVITWFALVGILSTIAAPALDIQAATGLLAIIVLLVIMNWFFHKIYWTGWISMHNKKRKELMNSDNQAKTTFGLAMLGLSAMYREGFEVDLFLQSLRMQVGSAVVLEGVAIGVFFTAIVGVLTFTLHHKLPYKKMLVLTGVMLGIVLIVMVGESVQEMQQANWIGTTAVNLPIPDWMGTWFAVFPNIQGLIAQGIAALAVLGSYFYAENMRVWRPRKEAGKLMAAKAQQEASIPTTPAPALNPEDAVPVLHSTAEKQR
jgi:high-affinity iron transporter